MKAAAVNELFRRLKAERPEPVSELLHRNHFELLIAVLLSAQATDKSVNKATPTLFKLAPDPQAMLDLGEEKVRECIKTIGLYNSKAANIIKTCQRLLDVYEGEIPQTREALESLPGVGRKTANVVLNNAFGIPTIAVDTHIFRVSNRIGLAPGKNVLAVEKKLLKVVPESYQGHAHHWLIFLGRYTCMARKPKCTDCLIRDLCQYKDKLLD